MDEKQFDYINVIPFIDIMLVLLTIVLTTSTFIAQGTVQVDLPKASATSNTAQEGVCIEIDIDGSIILDAKTVSLAALNDRLRTIACETPILIRADRQIALQAFVDVLDKVKSLGFTKVSLQTETLP
jgi:biopolymer transport protein ExbD